MVASEFYADWVPSIDYCQTVWDGMYVVRARWLIQINQLS